jgi:hypothetical protein
MTWFIVVPSPVNSEYPRCTYLAANRVTRSEAYRVYHSGDVAVGVGVDRGNDTPILEFLLE